ncbi:hypothetical protein DPEC_G00112890 [Dallia pectoralis]|uniref:Uncharacterized protein n=1 Tax=Dallia pectoralis TaxID=75939 RepID=A0ACC2GTK4_DALPE|nr:hypothetical protein DPEC_G00112890 [Dallia pectoralis]
MKNWVKGYDEEMEGQRWLSQTQQSQIHSPFGLAGMLPCGELQDVLIYQPQGQRHSAGLYFCAVCGFHWPLLTSQLYNTWAAHTDNQPTVPAKQASNREVVTVRRLHSTTDCCALEEVQRRQTL